MRTASGFGQKSGGPEGTEPTSSSLNHPVAAHAEANVLGIALPWQVLDEIDVKPGRNRNNAARAILFDPHWRVAAVLGPK